MNQWLLADAALVLPLAIAGDAGERAVGDRRQHVVRRYGGAIGSEC